MFLYALLYHIKRPGLLPLFPAMEQILINSGQHAARTKLLFNPLGHLPGRRVLGGEQHSRVLARVVDLTRHQQPLVHRFIDHIIRQKANSLSEDLALALGIKIRHQDRLLAVQQPADFFINRIRGVFHHDIRIEAQLAFGDRFRHKRQRVIRRNSEHPANGADFGVINTAAVEQRIRRADGNIGLVINNGVPDAVIDLGGNSYLTGGKLFLSTCSRRAVCRGV